MSLPDRPGLDDDRSSKSSLSASTPVEEASRRYRELPRPAQIGLRLLEQGRVTSEAQHEQTHRDFTDAVAADTQQALDPPASLALFRLRPEYFSFRSAPSHRLPDLFEYRAHAGHWAPCTRLEC